MTQFGFSPSIQRLLEAVATALPPEAPVYLVGGAVRDLLLSRPVHDLDLIVPSGGVRLGRRLADQINGAFYPLDARRDTGRIVVELEAGKRSTIDLAAMRGPSLEDDLRDRDFTLNALAIDLRQPERLIDPLHGQKDLLSKTLKPCSAQSIQNDPVRLIRAVRLSLDFGLKIEPQTARLLKAGAPELNRVSAERVRDELFRILDGKSPASALRLLDMLGGLAEVLPETQALKGVQQSSPHTQDVWEHSLSVLSKLEDLLDMLRVERDPNEKGSWVEGLVSLRLGRFRQLLAQHLSEQLNPDRTLRALLFFSALYHDIGKAETRQTGGDGRVHFYEHEVRGGEIIQKRGQALRLSNPEIERSTKIVRHHMRPLHMEQTSQLPSRRTIYRFFTACGAAGVDVCLLSLADRWAAYGAGLPQNIWANSVEVTRALLEAWWLEAEKTISPPALLNGEELMHEFKLTPGPQIGQLLAGLKEAQAVGEVQNREQALEFIRARLDQG